MRAAKCAVAGVRMLISRLSFASGYSNSFSVFKFPNTKHYDELSSKNEEIE